MLPIIDTEILPTRHFIDDGTSRREVPAEDVWRYTASGRPGHLHPLELRKQASVDLSSPENHYTRPPTVNQEPILADQKTYVTEEGYSRTEYLWLHPPVFEDFDGRTRSVLIPAGLSPEWKAVLLRQYRRPEEGRYGGRGKVGQEDIEPMAKRRKTQDSETRSSPDAHATANID